jgi:hypothetical protein
MADLSPLTPTHHTDSKKHNGKGWFRHSCQWTIFCALAVSIIVGFVWALYQHPCRRLGKSAAVPVQRDRRPNTIHTHPNVMGFRRAIGIYNHAKHETLQKLKCKSVKTPSLQSTGWSFLAHLQTAASNAPLLHTLSSPQKKLAQEDPYIHSALDGLLREEGRECHHNLTKPPWQTSRPTEGLYKHVSNRHLLSGPTPPSSFPPSAHGCDSVATFNSKWKCVYRRDPEKESKSECKNQDTTIGV